MPLSPSWLLIQSAPTWCARQIKSKSCLCRNFATTSEPKVNDTPRSFSPQPCTSLSGSDHSKSHSRPWSGTSVGLMIRRICSMDWRSGESPGRRDMLPDCHGRGTKGAAPVNTCPSDSLSFAPLTFESPHTQPPEFPTSCTPLPVLLKWKGRKGLLCSRKSHETKLHVLPLLGNWVSRKLCNGVLSLIGKRTGGESLYLKSESELGFTQLCYRTLCENFPQAFSEKEQQSESSNCHANHWQLPQLEMYSCGTSGFCVVQLCTSSF